MSVFIYLMTEDWAMTHVILQTSMQITSNKCEINIFCLSKLVRVLDLTWYEFMETVMVAEVIMGFEPLRSLAQGPTLHICFIVLHQSVLK